MRQEAGYTLFELVAAMTVLALVGVAAVSLVVSSTDGYRATGVANDASHYLGYLSHVLVRDAAAATAGGVAVDPDNPDQLELTWEAVDGTNVVVRYHLTAAGEVVRTPVQPGGSARVVARGLDPDDGVRFSLSDDDERLEADLLFRDGPDRWPAHLQFCLMGCQP